MLNPPSPNTPLPSPPVDWDMQPNHFRGILVSRNTRTKPNFARLFDPTSGCSFFTYSKNALSLPLGVMVTFSQGKQIAINRVWQRGAKSIQAYSAESIDKSNRNDSIQLWGEGILISYSKMNGMGTVKTTTGSERPIKVMFSPGELLPGSHLPPVGSPVRYQTCLTPPSNKNGQGKIRLVNIFYDYEKERDHVGLLPSYPVLSSITENFGGPGHYPHLFLGVPGSFDARGVGISDLTSHGVDLLTRPSLTDILDTSLRVLTDRWESLQRTAGKEADPETQGALSQLAEAIPALSTANADVLCLGSTIKPSAWTNIINNGLAKADQGAAPDFSRPIGLSAKLSTALQQLVRLRAPCPYLRPP